MKSKKAIAILMGLMLLGTAGLSACNFDSVDSSRTEPSSDNSSDIGSDDSAIISGTTEHGVKVAMSRLTTEEYAEYGVSAQAETAYALTATVTPANAYVQGIDWTIEFVNASSEWASGKSISEYMTLSVNEGLPSTAVLSCLLAFGEQIKVTATSQDNENIYAECIMDYAKRFRATGGNVVAFSQVSGGTLNRIEYSLAYGTITTVDVKSYGRNPVQTCSLAGNYSLGTGTVTEPVTEKYELYMSDGLKTALQGQGVTVGYEMQELTESSALMFDWAFIYGCCGTTDKTKLAAAVGENTEDCEFYIKYSLSTEHDSTYLISKIKINPASLIPVESVSLDLSLIHI